MQSYQDFETACKLLLTEIRKGRNDRQRHREGNGDASRPDVASGAMGRSEQDEWTWTEHPKSARHGWLQKRTRRRVKSSDLAGSSTISIADTGNVRDSLERPSRSAVDGKDSSGAHHGTGDVETDTDGLATLEEEDEEDETKQNGTACAHDRSNSTYPSSASSSSTSTASTAPAAAVANTQSVNVEIHLHIVFSATYRVPQLMFQAVDMTGTPLDLPTLRRLEILKLPPDAHEMQAVSSSRIRNEDDDKASDQKGVAEVDATSSAAAADESNSPYTFASILQDAHPSTGEMMWSLHPCEIESFVGEVLKADEDGDGDVAVVAEEGNTNAGRVKKGSGSGSGAGTEDDYDDDDRGSAALHLLGFLKACMMVCGTAVDMR